MKKYSSGYNMPNMTIEGDMNAFGDFRPAMKNVEGFQDLGNGHFRIGYLGHAEFNARTRRD